MDLAKSRVDVVLVEGGALHQCKEVDALDIRDDLHRWNEPVEDSTELAALS